MTPDKARALLDGTTPGPWIPSRSGYIGSAAGVMIHDGHVLGDTDADTCLIAAAPDMARTIAGMREEYRAEQQVHDEVWLPLCDWYDHDTAQFFAAHVGDGVTRIVRRYVTNEEEA